MPITVLCFATIREQIGKSSLSLDPPIPFTVTALLMQLKVTYPSVAAHFDTARVAVNQEFVEVTHPLQDGDEVAIIPPVSGG